MPTAPPDPGPQDLTLDNTDPPDNLVTAAPLNFTNQQLWIALTGNNCDFSRFRPDGRDFQVYDTDGTTPLLTSLRNWKAGNVGLRFDSRYPLAPGNSPTKGPWTHGGGMLTADLGYPNPPHTIQANTTDPAVGTGTQEGNLYVIDRNHTVVWSWMSPNRDLVNSLELADLDADGVPDTILVGTARLDLSLFALDLSNPPNTRWVYPMSTMGNTYVRSSPVGNLRHDLPGNEVVVCGSQGIDSAANGAAHGKIALLRNDGTQLWAVNQDPAVTNHTTQYAVIADLEGTGQAGIVAGQSQHIYRYDFAGAQVWQTTHDGNRNYYGVAAARLRAGPLCVAAVAGVAFNDAYVGILTVLDNNGATIFEKTLPCHGYGVKAVDLDGDGWDELIVTGGTAAGGPSSNVFGPPIQGWGHVFIFDRFGNELFAVSQQAPTKDVRYGQFDGTGKNQIQGADDAGWFMRWNVDVGPSNATVKVVVPSIPWKQVRTLHFGSTGAATQPPRGDRYFDLTGADGSAPANMVQQIGVWTIQGGQIASPNDGDTATAACLEAADINAEAFEWEFTAYKPGQGTGSSTYYNAARYRCTSWSGGRPDGYAWQHAQNGQIALSRTASGSGSPTYTVTATPVNTVTFSTTDKVVYRCVIFGDWHTLYANKNDTGFLQLFNIQDTNAGKKSTAGSIAFLSQRGQTRIAASTIWTAKNSDGNSGPGPVPFLWSLDSNAPVIPPPSSNRRRRLILSRAS